MVVDFRCPNCNQPVVGDLDNDDVVITQQRPPNQTIMNHYGIESKKR